MEEKVEFVDIQITDEMIDRAVDVLESGRLVKGPECESLENEFAAACGTQHAIGVSNGTAALLLAMKALGIEQGDQVFAPAHTYFATVSPVLELGAEPVFVDIDPDRYTMDPDQLRAAIEAAHSPTAVAVTHMHGQPTEMDPILDIVNEYELDLIEDSAQAHLAEYNGDTVGSLGDVGCFSFYPTKNMTVGGDGGMITTDNDEIAATARALRNHGRDKSGSHTHLGLNYRLDEVKAAIGREQLRALPEWTTARRTAADQYDARLASVEEITTPSTFENSKHVYHHYPVQVPENERDGLREYLDQNNIGTGIHYEVAVHEHPAVQDRTTEADAPTAESLCRRTVSLPMHPMLTESEIEYVCSTIKKYFQ